MVAPVKETGDGAGTYLSKDEQVALATRARGGDQVAWEKLQKAFSMSLRGQVLWRIKDLSRRLDAETAADDLCQDIFAEAFRNLGRYDPAYSFYTYLRNIAGYMVARFREGIFSAPPPHEDPSNLPDVPAPGVTATDAALFQQIVRVVCRCGKPHQVLAFGFTQLLQWKPREVLEELSGECLRGLTNRFVADYEAVFVSVESPARLFDELRRKMDWEACRVYPEPEYRTVLGDHGQRQAGDLSLEEFYGADPAASLADWAYGLKVLVRRALDEGTTCSS